MEKIDIHCHATKRPLEGTVSADATLDAIATKMQEHNIERTLVFASYFPHRGSGISNFRIHQWIQDRREQQSRSGYCRSPDCSFDMVGSLDIRTYFYQGMSELEELASMHALKGIKVYTGYQEIDLQDAKTQAIARLAVNANIPLFFHTGYSYSAMRSTGIPSYAGMVTPTEVGEIASQNLDARVVICHLGKPFFDDTIATLRAHPNVWTDASGLLDSRYEQNDIPACAESLRRVLHEAGPHKVLFGTDFPVETHDDAIKIADQALREFSTDEKRLFYHGNALKLLGGRQ